MGWSTPQEEWPERQTTQESDGTRTHVRVFIMESDSDTDDGATALLSGLLPPMFSQHPNDGGALLLKRTPRGLDESPRVYRVTLDYSSKVPQFPSGITSSGGEGTGGSGPEEMANENPLLRTPDIFFDSETIQEVLEFDHDGKRYATSAHEPFDPPKVQERELMALNITRNLPSFNPAIIGTYSGAVNEVDFLGYATDEVLLRKLTARPKWEHGYFYWEVYARFVFNPKLPTPITVQVIADEQGGEQPLYRGTWHDLVLDAGYRKLVAGVQQEIMLPPNGQRPSRPVHLNGTGVLLSDVTQEVNAVYLKRRPRHRRDFNNLQLF